MKPFFSGLFFAMIILGFPLSLQAQIESGNLFTDNNDIGKPMQKGSFRYLPDQQAYEITGAGENMWADHDAFHYAWRRVKGDFILRARVQFNESGGHPHRKTGLMLRSSLREDAAYVDAVRHGDGLSAMQYRQTPGGHTRETRLPVNHPSVLQLERKGNHFVVGAAEEGEPMVFTDTLNLKMDGNLYLGMFICSHAPKVREKAVFDNVRLTFPAPDDFVPYEDYGGSRLEVLNIYNKHRQLIHTSQSALEAPNWDPNTRSLICNSQGRLYDFPLDGSQPTRIETGFAVSLNNDHGLSPDNKEIAISHYYEGAEKSGSRIYIVPRTGGTPRPVTDKVPSYWHGWSPDGQNLIYTAQRNGAFNIYRIPVKGGTEKKLTNHPMLDDGSEYSPDGQFIYFNSARTGTMQIWRMKADGSDLQQVTSDEYNDWFPHPSPDGKWLVFLSYPPYVNAQDHPHYKRVMLRMLPVDQLSQEPEVLTYVYGGQGTINVPCWSPDSRKIAFVSYSF